MVIEKSVVHYALRTLTEVSSLYASQPESQFSRCDDLEVDNNLP